MSDLTAFNLVGNGETITLRGESSDPFIHVQGSTGFWMAPTSTRYMTGSGTGSVFLGKRLKARAMVIKLAIQGESRQDVEDRLQTLSGVFRDDDCLLQAAYSDGSVWQLGVTYESGLEGGYATDDLAPGGMGWVARADVAVTAPDPYWRRAIPETFALELPKGESGFLTHLARLRLNTSLGIGDTMISNPGSVPAAVSWTIRGPAGAGTEMSINGVGFRLQVALAATDTVVIDASRPGVPAVTLNGVRDYGVLDIAPKFPDLPAGDSLVHLLMPGAVAPTWVDTGQVMAINEITNPNLATGLDGYGQSGEFSWAGAHTAVFESDADIAVAMWWEFTEWSQPWISTIWQASGDGVHVFVEFFDADGQLIQTTYVDGLAAAGLRIPDGCVRVRVGVGFVGRSGSVSRAQVVFQQSGYPYFDGDSGDEYSWEHKRTYRWTGAQNASTSQELVDGVVTRTNLMPVPNPDSTWTAPAVGSTFTREAKTDGGPRSDIPWSKLTFSSAPTSSPFAVVLPRFAISPNSNLTVSVWVASSWTGFSAVRVDTHLLDPDGNETQITGKFVKLSEAGVWEIRSGQIATGNAVKAYFGVAFSAPQAMPTGTWIGVGGLLLESGTTVGDFFSGDTPDAGAGRSFMHVLAKTGGSLIQGQFRPGKEVVV